MILSRMWWAKLGGCLQLDLSYAIILVFEGQTHRLYRVSQIAYTISSEKDPNNFLVCAFDDKLGNCILITSKEEKTLVSKKVKPCDGFLMWY